MSALLDMLLQSALFAPSVACIALGLISGMVGSIVVLKKQALLGEALSHACYPGMALGIWISTLFALDQSSLIWTFAAGIVFAWLGLWSIEALIKRYRVSADAALCVVLSSFFALGLLFISAVQNSSPALVKKLHVLLLGQAATISEAYAVYCLIALVLVLLLVFVLFRSIKTELFDPTFARLMGLFSPVTHALLSIMIVMTLILGAKMMGVVLMSSLLIFPTVTARLWSSSFVSLMVLSSAIGAICCASGFFLSHYATVWLTGITIPTGPAIAVLLALFFFISYLAAPHTGLIVRVGRRFGFRARCVQENLLKSIWRLTQQKKRSQVLISEIAYSTALKPHEVEKLSRKLARKGYVTVKHSEVQLEEKGSVAALKLVRLHRLWELYLVEFCNMPKDRVHPSAEEMEHILTPQIEEALELLLQNPTVDPHKQPIPQVMVEKVILDKGSDHV